MTYQPLTKAEREELRKIIAEARDVCHCGQYVDEHTESDNHAALAMDTQESDRLTAASLEAMPRLLADLDAAEAKIEAVTDVPDDIHEAIEELAESAYAWADSDTEPVSELAAKERIADSRLRVMVSKLLAQRDRAEAERDALKAQLDEREGDMHARIRAGYDATVADSWRAKVAEVEAERDALKAKLAAAEEERDTQATTLVEERDDAKAKLAALADRAQALTDTYPSGMSVSSGSLIGRLRAAIAAARGGAS